MNAPQATKGSEKNKEQEDGDNEDKNEKKNMKKKKEKEKRKKEKKKEKKKKKEKRKRDEEAGGEDEFDDHSIESKKKKKKQKKHDRSGDNPICDAENVGSERERTVGMEGKSAFSFDFRYIVAPMVGASELAFRLLCRKYGAQLAYTPMMSASQFVREESYRQEEFQTVPEDRPLVCHFAANDPKLFADAARLVQHQCDAIDLNLGCPQRTAFVGHFGSYLMGPDDRDLVLDIVREGCRAVSIPIFVKIRLLDTIEDTIQLVRQLRDAGASLVAIHARYRATWDRNGPGARDGPALLEQVQQIRLAVQNVAIISNGNVITYDDVVNNLNLTNADGIMSAEGILDNPALFLPRYQSPHDQHKNLKKQLIEIADPSPLPEHIVPFVEVGDADKKKKARKWIKKLREIERIEKKQTSDSINDDERKKLDTKTTVERELKKLTQTTPQPATSKPKEHTNNSDPITPKTMVMPLSDLQKMAQDKISLASEYMDLVRRYPVKIRSVIFHVRRMCKELLNQYQLMEECLASKDLDDLDEILRKLKSYRTNPSTFIYDREKAEREKLAQKRKQQQDGKRKAYEARMVRKAKREGKSDLEFYLRRGADVPTVEFVQKLKKLSKKLQLEAWTPDHCQHCIAFHLDEYGCKRDRACAFLHVDAKSAINFNEGDEISG